MGIPTCQKTTPSKGESENTVPCAYHAGQFIPYPPTSDRPRHGVKEFDLSPTPPSHPASPLLPLPPPPTLLSSSSPTGRELREEKNGGRKGGFKSLSPFFPPLSPLFFPLPFPFLSFLCAGAHGNVFSQKFISGIGLNSKFRYESIIALHIPLRHATRRDNGVQPAGGFGVTSFYIFHHYLLFVV